MNPYSFDYHYSTKHLNLTDSVGYNPSLPGLNVSPSDCTPLIIAGVDEVGRGPLAGPVVVAAVILPPIPEIAGLGDSKALSEKKRNEIFPEIQRAALAISVSILDAQIIDEINILAATLRGMRNAIHDLKIKPDLVLVDGNQKPKSRYKEETIVKGDSKSAAIMAASIIAKVTRDRMMVDYHASYPHYGFDRHKGYGASSHIEAIKKFGPCPIHRKSFEPIKSLIREPVTLL